MTSPTARNASVDRYAKDLRKVFADRRMVVFLCGPALADAKPGAQLRKRLMERLQQENFEVVLGEDDGLEALRAEFKQLYAHENELAFIEKECGAIVLIADSVGSYCELGLFAYVQSRSPGPHYRDFILIIDKKYKGKASYLNEGPARAIHHFGFVVYDDLASFDESPILERLMGRRAVSFLDRRGRPRKKSDSK